MTKDEALKLALEFIERVNKDGWILADFEPEMYATITAIKKALAQPQRTWVGLTDEEIAQGCKESWVTEQAFQSAVWWAEDKLKEKNNA